MQAIETVSQTLGTALACDGLGVARASVYRQRQPAVPPAACSTLLHTERFLDQAPAQVRAALLDERVYLCSPCTMYRIVDGADELKERRHQVARPHDVKHELSATQANERWSWDITKLLGPAKWTSCYLSVILDVFSRDVVGWMVAPRERAVLAERLIEDTCVKQGIEPGQLTRHADRGSSMRSKPVAVLLVDLGVVKTHSRPHVSNDTPYSEAQDKTRKYCPACPARVGALEDARAFGQRFFAWYHHEHHHSGLNDLTPAMVHDGVAHDVRDQRMKVLAWASAAHPEQFLRGVPRLAPVPTTVWIDPASKKIGARGCPRNDDRHPGRPAGPADVRRSCPVFDQGGHAVTSPATLKDPPSVSQHH